MPSPVGGIAAQTTPVTGANQADSAMSAISGMGSDGFLQLMVAQMQYQNPMEPTDPGDMMNQTAALAQLDATQQMLTMQRRDMGLQQAVMAAGLIGTEVSAQVEGGEVRGLVDAVRYTESGPVLEIDGQEAALDDVTELRRSVTDA